MKRIEDLLLLWGMKAVPRFSMINPVCADLLTAVEEWREKPGFISNSAIAERSSIISPERGGIRITVIIGGETGTVAFAHTFVAEFQDTTRSGLERLDGDAP